MTPDGDARRDDVTAGGERSDPARITRLRRRGAVSTVVTVEVDGERLGALEDVEVVRLGLSVGLPLDDDLRSSILASAGEGEARRRGARLLASRPHARREFERKVARTAGSTLANIVVADFEERGLIDDDSFANRVVDRQLARGYGPLKIGFDLRRAGVDRTTVARTIAAVAPQRVREALLVALRGETGRAARERAARRGFPRDAMEDLLGVDDDTI